MNNDIVIFVFAFILKRTIHSSKDFMKKYNLKNNTMNESQLQKIYNYRIYPRDS